ncbi:MAG: hypothetical protein M0R41_17290 [Methylobacter tundripaludum]|nr:hypothetical protein [Methylobacter tundripaludum]
MIDWHKYTALHEDDTWEDQIKAIITTELAEKIPEIKNISSPCSARLLEDLAAKQND